MKELSIEEKAKRYDKAINTIRNLVKAGLIYEDAAIQVFSELKESEGERVWIINYLNNRVLNSTIIAEKENLKKAIAWLENQGEQKPAWSEEDEQRVENLLAIIEGHGYPGEVAWLKSLKERVQLKQEWSEVDAMQLDAAIHIVANSGHTCTSDWLKALKERVQLQNSYNPYKEVVESIAEMCKHYDKISHNSLRDFYDNVKVKCKDAKEYDSLYLQNIWKPSDLQIECLSDAIKHYNSQGYTAPVLKELLEQLKKLREE